MAGQPVSRPRGATSRTATASAASSGSSGRPGKRPAASSAVKRAPRPAYAAWPSEIWPPRPVTTTRERSTTPSAGTCTDVCRSRPAKPRGIRKRTTATIHAPGGVATRAVAVRGSASRAPIPGSASAAISRATTKRFAPSACTSGSRQPDGCSRVSWLWATPMPSATTTATGRLRIRAATATATTSMTSNGRPYGSRRTYGARSTPVSPAVKEPKAQPAAATRSASMPPRTASERSSTTARSSRPKRVQRVIAPTPTASTSVTANCPQGSADTSVGASEWAPGPQISAAPPTSSTNTPIEATSVCAGSLPRTDSGRKTKRSRTRPMPGATTSRVSAAASGSGQSHSTVSWRSR